MVTVRVATPVLVRSRIAFGEEHAIVVVMEEASPLRVNAEPTQAPAWLSI